MVNEVPGSDWQQIQHFISNSPWSTPELMQEISRGANKILGGSRDTALLIDESAHSKKGTKSAGVGRQHNGRLGKTDNCQVGVYSCLNRFKRTTIVGFKLFLPECWSNDKKRCDKAGIPKDKQKFKTKPELALELVKEALATGLEFAWVGADGLYGNCPKLLRDLCKLGVTFMMDVHNDQHIYLEDPKPFYPTGRRGQKLKTLKGKSTPIALNDWVEQQPADAWRNMLIRGTTKGLLFARILHKKVWLWDKKEEKAHHWHLVVRQDDGKIKYSLSNAPMQTSASRLAFMQGQRCFVERIFQDAKDDAGLSQCQVRTWRGWHHHGAIVAAALLFILECKKRMQAIKKMLSAADVREFLEALLPKRKTSIHELMRQMEYRHKARSKLMKNKSLIAVNSLD